MKKEQKQNGVLTFVDDHSVKVMCRTSGKVSYNSDVTHNSYVWTDYGDVQAMTYRELAEIKRCHSCYLDDGIRAIYVVMALSLLSQRRLKESLIY